MLFDWKNRTVTGGGEWVRHTVTRPSTIADSGDGARSATPGPTEAFQSPINNHQSTILLALAAAIAAVLFCAPPAAGQVCSGPACQPAAERTQPHPAVVRLVNETGPRRSYASGTLIAKSARAGVVLTVAHVFRDGVGTITVLFPDGRRYGGVLEKIDHAHDLALVRIAPPAAEPLGVAAIDPAPGDGLRFGGYGPDGRYRSAAGRTLGYGQTAGTARHQTLILTGAARDGDSGGPVLNVRGVLVGVIWGTDGRTVSATCCQRVRRFLGRLLSPLRPPAATPARIGDDGHPPASRPGPTESFRSPIPPAATPARIGDDGHPPAPPPMPGPTESFRSPIPPSAAPAEIGDASSLPAGVTNQAPPSTIVDSGDDRSPTPGPTEAFQSPINNQQSTILLAAQTALPFALAAAGISFPPAAIVAGFFALRTIGRRRPKRKKVDRPAYRDYAEAQAAHFTADGGRDGLWDQTLGRLFDQETTTMLGSADDAMRDTISRLRDTVLKNARRHFTAGAERTTISDS